jgi:hypothetical protein
MLNNTMHVMKIFPGQCSYSFKALGQNAALHGAELRLLMPSDSEHKESLATGRGIAIECFTRATIDEHEHTPNQASKMANPQFDDVLFLNFSSPGFKTMLPLEIFKGTFAIPSVAKLTAIFLENQLEGLAQAKLEEQLWTSTTETLQLATSWLHNCIENHPQCRPLFEDKYWHPTRLLYLGSSNSPALRIDTSGSIPHGITYAALTSLVRMVCVFKSVSLIRNTEAKKHNF